MDDEVTISCQNHHQNLVGKLWNYFLSCRDVDFNVSSSGGRSIRAHRLILDLFLSPEKLNQSAQQLHLQHWGSIGFLLEFLYSGEVTVRQEQLGTLLKVARESNFQLLVDVLETEFQDYFAINTFPNTVVGRETRQNLFDHNEDRFVDPPNETISESCNRTKSKNSSDWQSNSIKLEPVEDSTSQNCDNDSGYQPGCISVYEKQTEGPLNDHWIQQINSPPNLESLQNAGLHLSNEFQNDEQSSSTNGEFDGNIYGFNQELDEPLPMVAGESDQDAPSMDPLKEIVDPQGILPTQTLSSGSNYVGSPVLEENPDQFGFRFSKIKVEPDYKAKMTIPMCRSAKNGKRTNAHLCMDCGKRFNAPSGLEAHMRSHTNERPFSCDLCQKTFTQQAHVARHRMLHTGERPFQCQLCPKTFVDRWTLITHQRLTHDGLQSYQCKETGCSATFTRGHDLGVHRKTEHPDAPPDQQCHLCERAFYLPHHLDKHLRGHRGIKVMNFPCDVCPKVFYRADHLASHSRTHAVIKPFQCHQCPKAFAQMSHLEIHLRWHTKKKPYRCDHEQCGKTFKQQISLSYHKLTHSGIKAFKCTHPNCNKEFYSQSELNKHHLRHGQNRPFVCEFCDKAFKLLTELNRHVRLKHPFNKNEERNECDICGETFDDLGNLNLHAETHV